MAYPGIYRAKAIKLDGHILAAYVPQVFGDVQVTIENFIGDPPSTDVMGWVSFQGGSPEFPVWHGAGAGVGNGNGNGGSTGTGVTDGDKGDIIVSGTGTSWLLDPEVVTPVAKTVLDDTTTAAMRTTLGLGSVDNTTDATKPVSTPQQTALNLKADKTTTISVTSPLTGGGDLSGNRTIGVPTFASGASGVVPPSGGGAINFLRADGTWALPPGAGGGISGITVKEGGVSLGTAFTSLLFGAAGFDVTAAGIEASIVLDLTEYTGGALPIAGGGTGATTAAAALTALGGVNTTALTNAIAAHEADTTAVHGIADTSLLATTAATNSAISAAVTAHEVDTTAVHGIADTALLVTLAATQTLTNKTFALGANMMSGTTAQFNAALSDNDFVTLTGAEVLTSKTINLTSNTLTGSAAQFNTALNDSDFYTTGGTDVSVADGGTGRSTSSIANGVIAAGTTATGPFQTITPGTAGQFLKSAGASVPGSFVNITTSDISGLDTTLLNLTTSKADKIITVTATSPLTGGGTLAANFSIGIPASTTTVVGATRLATAGEATTGTLDTVAVTPVALATGYLKLAGGTITPGSLNITGTTAQLTFGSRSGMHLLLASTTHGLGVQGTGGAGQDTVYFRAPTAFYWYKGGFPHSDIAGNPGIGGVQLLSLVETGTPTTSFFKYKGSTVWTAANNGHTVDSSGINADMLDTHHATYFASSELMESLLGDLLYVGTYNAAAYGTTGNKPAPAWELGPTVYRHGMYWVCSSSALLDFIDADASGRYDVENEEQVEVANGDWIIAIDPLFSTSDPAHDAGTDLTLADMVFQYIPFSAENYVKAVMLDHLDAEDPHPQYFKEEYDDDGEVIRYAPLVHNHQAEIRQQIINHQIQDPWAVYGWSWDPAGSITLTVDARHSILPNSYINLANVDTSFNGKWRVLDTETDPTLITFEYSTTPPPGYTVPVTLTEPGQVYNDPHSQYLDAAEAAATYLTEERADDLYADIVHNHDGTYEPAGVLALHEAAEDPHPLYLTQTEAEGVFALSGHTHPEILELHPTDGANSADIWIGEVQPTYAGGLAVGDLWIQTAPLGLQAPTVKTLTVTNGATSASVVISWQQWAASESLTGISLERSTDGTTWPTVLTTSQALTTWTDTGRTANTRYYYRIKAINSAGSGDYSPVVSIVTKPADVTGVNATSTSPTHSAVSWTAAAGGTGYTYEVYVNSVLKTTQAGLSYTATGITENESTTFGIRSKGSTGLFGTTVSDTIVSLNDEPVQPASITVSSIDYDSAVVTWPASTSSDRRDYEVFLGSTSRGFTTALTSTYTGLSASTLYTFQVRTRDTGLLLSPLRSTTATTAAPPDTTPPTAPTITAFEPYSTYGNMRVTFNLNTGTTQYRVDSSTNNSTWTIEQNWTALAPGTGYTKTLGTYAAGTTVYCRVYARDAAGNSTYTNAPAYTLITSPTYITAHSTNHYRANGTWNGLGNSRPVQGYYSDPSFNATGCWFYNNKPTTSLYYGGRRTITSGKIWLKRMDGGTTGLLDVTMYVHKHTVTPSDGSAPQINVTGVAIAADLEWNGAAKSITLPATWADLIVQGTTYKGIAIFRTGTADFMTLANLSEDANTGRLEIHHLG